LDKKRGRIVHEMMAGPYLRSEPDAGFGQIWACFYRDTGLNWPVNGIDFAQQHGNWDEATFGLIEVDDNMRRKHWFFRFILAAAILSIVSGTLEARALYDINDGNGVNGLSKVTASTTPNRQYDLHNIGKLAITITNFGTIGTGFVSNPICDGETCPSGEFPINSNLEYLFAGSIWIGAVIGLDTLVSVGSDGWFTGITELLPDAGENGAIIRRSTLPSSQDYSALAVSEQDFISTFTDTFTDIGLTGQDPIDNIPHIPIYVSVKQSSYAWSYDYAEDFVLFDYQIANIGRFPIRDLYLAIYVDGDVYHESNNANGFLDDICGFRRTVAMPDGSCLPEDTVNIAWIADNDGDPSSGNWSFTSPVGVTGSRVVRTPFDTMTVDTTGGQQGTLSYSFNWWISNGDASLDFGPRLAGTAEDAFRSFNSHLGTPTGDRNKYYVMSHPEFDYDQLFTAVSHTTEGYLPPPRPTQAIDFANGYDTRYLLSFGPFDVRPGDTLPITLAYLAGDNFHVEPNDFNNYFDAFDPITFYNKLDFDDFGLNARWASWIFDNPGYDTDNNGDSGKYVWKYVYSDTLPDIPVDSTKCYYAGDGVPDFRGAAPPPAPIVHVVPGFGEVTLRWNGEASQNAIDVFSEQKDFEGFRVYYSQGNRASDFVMLASYDLEDFKVYDFIKEFDTTYWEQGLTPLTGDSLRMMYGPEFDPTPYYDEFHYFTDPFTGTLRYFVKQDWNQSDLTNPLAIHKVYPDASKYDLTDTTAEGQLRYYEYEYTIPNLQASVPYYFSVTAFDYGSLKVALGELETSPLLNAVQEYPLPGAESVEEQGLDVIVYPNPRFISPICRRNVRFGFIRSTAT